MSFKDGLYSRYFTTHLQHRKGVPTLREFQQRAVEHRQRLGQLLPRDKSARLIDLGCGNGHLVWWLQREGFSGAEGIEISAELVEQAIQLGVENVKQGDLGAHLRENPGRYHAIFMRDILEHFDRHGILEILGLCVESLVRDGFVVIQVPNAESPFFGRIRYGDFTHEVAFTTSSLAQVLRLVGLRPERFSPVGPLPSAAPKRMTRFLLWKGIEFLYKVLLYIELGRGERIVTQNLLVVATKATPRAGEGE